MEPRYDRAEADQRNISNLLLNAIPVAELEVLKPYLEPVDLKFKMSLYEAGQPIEYVYFVESGVVSLVTTLAEGDIVEVGTVGPEGMVGIPVILAADQIGSRAFVQIRGYGHCIRADRLSEPFPRCPDLHRLLLRYALALMNMIAQNAACNRTHEIDQRCARWLLMTHDRVHQSGFDLTQEFLGQMLGVRRSTVSIAQGMLSRAGLITYTRGRVTVLDRSRLEEASCDCYRAIRLEFTRLLGIK